MPHEDNIDGGLNFDRPVVQLVRPEGPLPHVVECGFLQRGGPADDGDRFHNALGTNRGMKNDHAGDMILKDLGWIDGNDLGLEHARGEASGDCDFLRRRESTG